MSRRKKTTKIILVDDHPIVRERLAAVLAREPGFIVCGEAESRQEALEVVAALRPDLVIIDLTLKDSSGLDLIEDLRERCPRLLMLVLSMHDSPLHAERAIRAGAQGYITKQEATRKVLQAIRIVLEGGTYLDKTVASQISLQMIGNRSRVSGGIDRLTDRELRVLEWLGRGFSVRQIAETMRLNIKTIETYRARIKDKLALEDSSEVLRYAIEWVHSGGGG